MQDINISSYFQDFYAEGHEFSSKGVSYLVGCNCITPLSDKSQPCIEKFSKTRSPPWKDITAENSAPKSCKLPAFGVFSATGEALIDLLENKKI
jgi:hypothetical protein